MIHPAGYWLSRSNVMRLLAVSLIPPSMYIRSPDVFIGGEQVTYLDIQPEFPPWQRMILGGITIASYRTTADNVISGTTSDVIREGTENAMVM
ncbi:TPA: hypothetical protein JLI19_001418 [Escherichia coli]|nr:hypothetical protein [Escherichia coli]HAW0156431.1 hypothetical protein [Escherichia coli]HBB5078823.1 hypothetical protein [Escherichia coli]